MCEGGLYDVACDEAESLRTDGEMGEGQNGGKSGGNRKCVRTAGGKPAAAGRRKRIHTVPSTYYQTIEISDAWKRFTTFLVVNLFQASEIFL